MSYGNLTVEYIIDRRSHLLSFESTTVFDIRNIWIKPGEQNYPKEYLQMEDLPYDFDFPLSMRMVRKYHSCKGRPAQFYFQLDPENQKTFAAFRLPCPGDWEMKHKMLNFFAWLTNTWVEDEIRILTFNDQRMVEIWKKRPITFFLQLQRSLQKQLIEDYNSKHLAFVTDDKDIFSIIITQALESVSNEDTEVIYFPENPQ